MQMRSTGLPGSDLERGMRDRRDVTGHLFPATRATVLAVRQYVLDGYFALVEMHWRGGIPEATALAPSGQGASSMTRS